MTRWGARALLLVLLLVPVLPGRAHSYRDPALRTVLDGVAPALPAGVSVSVRPSVLDELVLTNPTPVPLEVLGADGEPFLRVSADGVLADLASPDWYRTAVPEGSPALAPYAVPGAPPRWARVSSAATWSEFDPRLRPEVQVPAEVRSAGEERVVAAWSVPLRYGGKPARAQGHVLFSPVRGGLVVAVTGTPPALTATALQGELPGLFVRVQPGHRVEVAGADGRPFLRLADGTVLASRSSPTWRADRAARGRAVSGTGWEPVGTGGTFSWLDGRLRYPHDQPPPDQLGRQAVVQRWSIPVTVDGVPALLRGTVTWVPRADALRQVLPAGRDATRWPVPVVVGVAGLVVLLVLLAQRARRNAVRLPTAAAGGPGEQSG